MNSSRQTASPPMPIRRAVNCIAITWVEDSPPAPTKQEADTFYLAYFACFTLKNIRFWSKNELGPYMGS